MKLLRRHRDPVPAHPAAVAAREIVSELKAVGADLSERADQLEDVAERLNEVVREMRGEEGHGGTTGDNGTADA